MKSTNIITKSMGSCQCGDCFATVFSDGSVRYHGAESWQQSERKPFLGSNEPRRPYNSQLSTAAYDTAMKEL
jgi:hypothetical protein